MFGWGSFLGVVATTLMFVSIRVLLMGSLLGSRDGSCICIVVCDTCTCVVGRGNVFV